MEAWVKNVRDGLARERQRLIDELRSLAVSPRDERARPATGALSEEGDQAQASERQDVEFAVRERIAERINRLTAALERIANGTYGQCQRCGESIERERLEAIPEADTCLRCQQAIERGRRARPAA